MKFRLFLFIICFFVNFLSAEYKFHEWEEESLKHYLEEISQEHSPIGEAEHEKNKKQLKECLKTHNHWPKGFLAAKTILAYEHKTVDDLINIALFAYQATKNLKNAYVYQDLLRHASHLAFTKSTTNLEKAKALLLFSTASRNNQIIHTTKEIQNLYPLKKLREEDPRFKDILKFEFTNHELEETPEGAILRLEFSNGLNVEQPENYLEITPKVDGFIQADEKQISVSGFQAGIEYTVKIKPGITSLFDEKIDTPKELGFFVKDLKARINFPQNTYIYPLQEKIHLPIRTINVDKAQANLYRIPERGVINNMRSLMQRSYDLGNAEKMFSTELEFNGRSKPNQTITKNLDATKLVPALKPGIYVLEVRQKGVLNYYQAEVADQWFIITDIGLTTFKNDQTLLVHARAFSNAKSLKGIQLELVSADNDILATATTNADGFAEFPKEVLNGKAGKKPKTIFAKNEKLGFSFLTLDKSGFDFSDRGVDGREIKDSADAMVFSERGIYRPGEVVNQSVILRDAQGRPLPETPITLILKSPKGTEISREILKGNELGVYTTQYKLPDDSAIGMWSIEIFIDPTKNSLGNTTFRVDDFSPNKMELILRSNDKIAKLGGAQTCSLIAHYLYGSPVEDRQAILEAKISTCEHPFDQWKDFTFGLDNDKFVNQVLTGETSTIKEGKAELKIDIPQDLQSTKALQIDFTARLADTTSSQMASTSVNLFTEPYILGVRQKLNQSSKDTEIEIIAVNNEGKLVAADDLVYTFSESEAKYQWYSNGGSWSYQRIYQDKPLKKGDAKTGTDKPTLLSFKGEQAAPYVIEIARKDGTKLARYRIGQEYKSQKDRPDILNITSDSMAKKLGQEVVLNVKAPFDGEAIVIAGLDSVQLKDSVKLTKGHNIVKIPTHETWGTGAYVMISLVRPLDKKIDGIQSKRAVGIHWIKIDPTDRTLDVKLELPKEIKSKTQLKIPVHIENLNNKSARLMIAVVDEGVMGLTNFKNPDPITYFFGKRRLGLEMHDSYGYLIDPVDADVMEMRSGGDALALRRGAFVPKQNDKVLSFFDGNIHLDSDGKAEISMDIPVFFGKLRVYAVAVAKEKMGSQSGYITVKDDLIVDPNFPTFLTKGDICDLSVRVENTSDKPTEINVKINLESGFESNALQEKITLQPKEQKHFSILAKAKDLGDGVVKIAVSGDGIKYNTETLVEVRSAYQPTFVARKFQIKAKEKLDLKIEDALKGISTHQAVADLFITNQGPWNPGKIQKWLLQYPFGCNQQIISKGFAAIFGVMQTKGDQKSADYIEYKRACDEAIQLLNERQIASGGWGTWANDNADFELTAYALEMLIYAQNAGLNVPNSMIKSALGLAKSKITSADWQIKQGREKADKFAWLVKICANAQEIDTATTRYCFDEYFEKNETVIGKSALIAAVAAIQDLARVEKGIKSLNADIKKTLSLDQAAAIAGHLAAFRSIKSINSLIETLEEILHKAIDSDVTRLNTQTLALVLKANVDHIPPSSKEVNVQINKKTLTKKQYITYGVKPIEDLTIQNNGDNDIWVFVNACGIPTKPTAKQEQSMKITRTLYKPDGTKIDENHITLGERIVIVLEGHIENTTNEGYLLLSDWLPSGFTHSNTTTQYDWLKDLSNNVTVQKRHDRYIASWKQGAKNDSLKIAYEVIPIHSGIFELPGIYAENMMNPAHYAAYETEKITIRGRK